MRFLFALIILVGLALGAVIATTHFRSAIDAAEAREARSLTRGPILDRNGRVLAETRSAGNSAHRLYTQADLVQILGYRRPTGGWSGVEGLYNDFLDARKARQDWQTFFLHLQDKTADGGKLQLTIDQRLQRSVDSALGNNAGAIVVLDPRTGRILAMVSKPYCSPQVLRSRSDVAACRDRKDRPLLNRAIQAARPSGSTFKIMTITAALDSGRYRLGSIFSGADVYGPNPYFDNSLYGSNVTQPGLEQLTLAQALGFSDNFTFASIGLSLGSSTFLDYAHRYYLDSRVPFLFPIAVSRVAGGRQALSKSQLAQAAFGGPVDRATPLQMALIAATVANRGQMMAPELIRAEESPSGKIIHGYRPHVLRTVMSPKTASAVSAAMAYVVKHGTGQLAQIKGTSVAGKTGTAPDGERPDAWFIGFAPEQHPRVAVAVMRESAGEAAQYAAPIAKKVLEAGLSSNR